MQDARVVKGFSKEIDGMVLGEFEKLNVKWIPAKLNNLAVKKDLYLPIVINGEFD